MSFSAWNRGCQLGLLAHALSVLPVRGLGSAVRDRALYVTKQRLLSPFDTPSARRAFLRGLSPSVLRLVRRAVADPNRVGHQLHSVLEDVDQVIAQLTARGDHPLWSRVQIWTYQCLLSSNEAARLVRFGRVLFGGFAPAQLVTWRVKERDDATIAQVDAALEVLRDPWCDTAAKRDSIEQLTVALGNVNGWQQIENLLYHSIYYWPLLVVAPENTDRDLGISLPVSIDVTLGLDGGTHRNAENRPMRVTPQVGHLLMDDWYRHLARAARAGKMLWRAKHGNYGEFRRRVQSALVLFDFHAADSQVGVLRDVGFARIALDGGSAEAYLAQGVLNRLLGRSTVLASAATGALGKLICRPDGSSTLNFELARVGGVARKLEFVFESEAFERVVVPLANPEKPASTQSSEVVRAADLHTMADAVQVQGWRQHHYVRCPDVMWGVQSERSGRPGLLPKTEPRVAATLAQLKNSADAIVRSVHNSALAAVSALWHVNDVNRSLNPAPPGISWTVIRCCEFEQDLRFWRVVYDTAGAPPSAIYELLLLPTRAEAVRRIAQLLNRFAPDESSPSLRAPDVLVIVGLKALIQADDEDLTPSARPHKVVEVLNDLAAACALLPVPNDKIQAQIGQSRILVLQGDDDEFPLEQQHFPLDFSNRTEVDILRRLAVFEHGFTHRMAAVALARDAAPNLKETILDDLVERGLLREGQGRYHLPAAVRVRLQQKGYPDNRAQLYQFRRELAERHLLAGCALAPYAHDHRISGLALDVALRPEFVHEASHHLRLAARYTESGDLKQRALKVHGRVTRFAEMPTWGTVGSLLQARSLYTDAYDIAMDLLAYQRAGGIVPHPTHCVYAARAAQQWARSIQGRAAADEVLRSRLASEADQLFLQAIEHSAVLPAAERSVATLLAVTARAVFLLDTAKARDEEATRREYEQLTQTAIQLLRQGINPVAARGDWCESATDEMPDHAKAVGLYDLVLTSRQDWAQLWVKGLGAASLATDLESVDRYRALFDARKARNAVRGWDLMQKASIGWLKQLDDPRAWIRDRWKAGFQAFDVNEGWIADRLAADQRDHRIAGRIYSAVLVEAQREAELWIKGLGALVLGGDESLHARVRDLFEAARGQGLTLHVDSRWRRSIMESPPWVVARWQAGLKFVGLVV